MTLQAGDILVADARVQDEEIKNSVFLVIFSSDRAVSFVDLTRKMNDSGYRAFMDIIQAQQLMDHLPETQQGLFEGGPEDAFRAFFYIFDSETGPEDAARIGDTGYGLQMVLFKDNISVPYNIASKAPSSAFLASGAHVMETPEIRRELDFGRIHKANVTFRELLNVPVEERWQVADRTVDRGFSSSTPDFGGPSL